MESNLQESEAVVDIFEIDPSPGSRSGPVDPILQVHGRVHRVRVHPDLVPDVGGQILALEHHVANGFLSPGK